MPGAIHWLRYRQHARGVLATALPAAIAARLDAVQFFVDRPQVREAVRTLLAACPDVERALSRLSVDLKVAGAPFR